ncbi:MAG: class I SAM-dependent methyltransferase [Candidatus Dependentiae bacterium]|nr:class I SAM-dependent methyltransferase [Candidatus Dependentiae bacterium]
MSLLVSLGIIIVAVLLGSLAWRLSSKRHTLPCPSWLSWLVELDNPLARAHSARAIIDSFSFPHGATILDIGCGPGRVLLPLAQKIAPLKGQVTGLDIQADMIAKAQKKAQALGITNIGFIQGKIGQVALKKNQYDAALLVCVLGEIPEAERLLVIKEISEALKPTGIISVTETIFDPHFQSRKRVTQLMDKAGFVEQKSLGNRLAYTIHFRKE